MTDETVTGVHTSYLRHGGCRFALLTLDNGTAKPETLGPASLAGFAAAVRALDLAALDAVAVTGTGSVFCAGADLKLMMRASSVQEGEDIARQGLESLGHLAALPLPTFAFLNGLALGGGLELALHADYRTAAESVRAIGFPEVRLGLIPGWGGLDRTARLLGPETAARIAVTDSLAGRNLGAQAAHRLGLVDALCPADGFLAASLDFAAAVVAGRSVPKRPEPNPEGWEALSGIREQLDAKLHGAAPAPYRALDVLAAGAPEMCDGGGPVYPHTQEQAIRAFAELLVSDEARAGIYALQLTQSLAKKPTGRPDVQPLPVGSVGVVGAGLMASQLALVFARQLRVPVLITDLSGERIQKALDWIGAQLDKEVDRGRLDAADADTIRALITGTKDKAGFAGCDAVIEAVFEELAVKRTVLAELEQHVRPDALLLTNTSALSVADMGADLAYPHRLVGFHFFNPVAVLPLVEIVAPPGTDPAALSTAFELAKGLRKTAVLVTDSPGFVVNRLLTRLFAEVLAMIDDGLDPAVVDHALDPVGLPMTPLELLQFIGPAVLLHICERMRQAYPGRFAPMQTLAAVVEAGLPGYLEGSGRISPEAAALLPPARPADPDTVRGRILAALADEAEHMLDEGVVAGAEQLDLCMILGANYPFHTGGLTPLLDRAAGTGFHPGLRVPAAPATAGR